MPKSIRDHLKVELGDRIVFEPLVDGSVRIVAESGQVARRKPARNPTPIGSPDETVVKREIDDGLVQYMLKSPKVDGFELPLRRSRKMPPVLGR